MVRYLQAIYSIESFSIPDSILEFQYAQNQIIAQFDRNKKQEVLQKLSLIVLFWKSPFLMLYCNTIEDLYLYIYYRKSLKIQECRKLKV